MSDEVVQWLANQDVIKAIGFDHLTILHAQSDPSSRHWVIGIGDAHDSPAYFVKQHASEELYRQECDALQLLAPYAEVSEPLAVPKLLAASERLQCIALKWIDGQSISKTIRAAVGRASTQAQLTTGVHLAYRVGSWLKELNRRTHRNSNSYDRTSLCERFLDLMEIVQSANWIQFPHADSSRLIENFERNVSHFVPDSECLVHKDFWFEHIWTSRTQLIVLDFGRAHFGPPGRDAIQFCSRLRDLSKHNPWVSKKKCENLVRAFRDGHGPLDFNTTINRVWHLMTRAEQLAGLIEQSEKSSYKNRWVNRFRTRALAQTLRDSIA